MNDILAASSSEDNMICELVEHMNSVGIAFQVEIATGSDTAAAALLAEYQTTAAELQAAGYGGLTSSSWG